MDINYICKNPGVVGIFQYSSTSDNNQWLYASQCDMVPDQMNENLTAGYRYMYPTCAQYIAQLFKLWRGTVCFKISVAKTPFHNGRLVINFDPSILATTSTPYNVLGKTYTAILDLSENSSTIIKIPFLNENDYLNVIEPVGDSVFDRRWTSFGVMRIGALAPLLGPATVDQSVDVVVWKWFEDVELAQPTGDATYTYEPSLENLETKAEIQINLMNRDQENIIIFNHAKIDNGLKHAEENIGERITNMRSFLRMHRETYRVEGGSTLSAFRSVKTSVAGIYNNFDYVTYLAHIYRFYRGGFSVKIIGSQGVYVRSQLRRFNQSGKSGDTVLTPTHITYTALNPAHEIRIPFYSQTYRRVICDEYNNAVAKRLPYSIPIVELGTDAPHQVFLAGDDNLSYGWLIGPPTILQTRDPIHNPNIPI
jgi:hypothetical protein